MMRRRRPLLRGAMVAGGAYAVGSSAAKKKGAEQSQNQRISDLEAQQAPATAAAPAPPADAPAPPPAAPSGESVVDQLTKLKALLDGGVLSQDEFDAEKARILTH